jgi:hypothetical protein
MRKALGKQLLDGTLSHGGDVVQLRPKLQLARHRASETQAGAHEYLVVCSTSDAQASDVGRPPYRPSAWTRPHSVDELEGGNAEAE